MPELASRTQVVEVRVVFAGLALAVAASLSGGCAAGLESRDPRPEVVPADIGPAESDSECDPNYSGCVANFDQYGDVDCDEIPRPVRVLTGADPHGLDPDHDGVACPR